MKQLLSSFNGGEVTPLLEGRTDLVSLQKSCRLLRNFIPTSAGAAMRRPSLLYQATRTSNQSCKLISFVYDTSTRYVVSVSGADGAVEIYRSDGTLAWSGEVYSDAAFSADKLSYAQVNDILILAHPDFPPVALLRVSDTNWIIHTYTGINYAAGEYDAKIAASLWPAVLDEQVTSFAAETGGSDVVESHTVSKAIAATGNFIVGGIYSGVTGVDNGPCPAYWRLYTGTTAFVGTIKIEAADTYNAATWRLLYTITNASTGAMTLRQEWYHTAPYMRITVTRTSGTATMELRHVGSISAPTVWYRSFAGTPADQLWSSPPMFGDWATSGFNESVQVAHQRLKQQVELTVAASSTDEYKESAEIFIQGRWDFYTTGIWTGDAYVEVKESTGSWKTLRHLASAKDQNYSISGELNGETMRIRVVKYDAAASASTAVPRFVLTATDGIASTWMNLENIYATGLTNQVVAIQDYHPGTDFTLLAQATTAVSRGAFSPSQGYPSAVCIHDQRVYFAGTTKRPTTIWASSVNDLFNFRRTGFDDGGFMFEIASNEGNPIQWMLSANRGILAGTAGDEWLLDGADTGITPTNITARRQSRIGSAAIQAIPAAGSTIFVQRGAMHLMEYQFAWESQQFQAVDLSELVKHLTPSGIRAVAFSQNPEPTLWCVMLDGSLLSCTYNRAQEVIAWAKHTTSGTFESVCVTYGDTANADDVWFIVLRDSVRYLEKLDVAFWANLYNGGRLYHADSAYVKTGAAFTTVTGLTWLEGKTVKVIANGVAQADAVVSSGTVAVPSGTTHAVVGLGFDSELQPMPFDIPLQTGTVQGRKTHTPTFAARLYRSDAGQYADSASATLYPMAQEHTGAALAANTTGLVRLPNLAKMLDSCELYFKSTGALPLNFVTVIPSVTVYGE